MSPYGTDTLPRRGPQRDALWWRGAAAPLVMKILASLLLALPALGIAPGAASARLDDEPPDCRKCDSLGRQPCGEHRGVDCALEDHVLYCSVVDGCEACGGTGWVDCEHCENEEAQGELILRRDRVARSRADLAWIDEEFERPLRKAETEHFVLIWEMEGMKVGRKRLDEHEMLHLTAQRLEELFARYLEAFQCRESEFRKKTIVAVWWLPKDQVEGSLRLCNTSSSNGVKLMGATPRYSMCGNKQFVNDDEALHRQLLHNVAHVLLSHQSPSRWIGQEKYGWADAGVAHWFEYQLFERCTNYCYEEQNTRVDFRGGKYRPAVRKLVAMDEAPPVAQVFSRTTNDLETAEHAFAFSYVDFLLATDGAKFDKLAKRLRARAETRDALRDVYGWTPLEFEERWKAWVLETYPTR